MKETRFIVTAAVTVGYSTFPYEVAVFRATNQTDRAIERAQRHAEDMARRNLKEFGGTYTVTRKTSEEVLVVGENS